MLLDLLRMKDTSLVGAIGEAIARKYLWQKGITAYSPGHIRWLALLAERTDILNLYLEIEKNPDKLEKLSKADELALIEYSSVRTLGEERIRYLKDLWDYGPTWCWDYTGYSHHSKELYLIEVKTSRVGKRYSLKSSWSERSRKGYERAGLEKAKSLGFKLLLVNVELLDNWQFEVSDREL